MNSRRRNCQLSIVNCQLQSYALLLRPPKIGYRFDERWQPVNLSNAEKGILAQYLSAELDIRNQWQSFATLWGMKPETLRRAAAKAMEQKKSLVFQDRLKGLLRV